MPRRPQTHRPPGPARPPAEARPNAHQRGYTRRWWNYRTDYLRRHPVCRRCPEPARHVDHVRPVTGPDDPGFWDESNHQPLCAGCHSRKTRTEDQGKGRARRP